MTAGRHGSVAVAALGGGHGLSASLRALRTFCTELTAIVTVADNGGSSGRLREELGVLPPGDLRQALAALCPDDEDGRRWRDILQHRFGGYGQLRGHALGNLLMVAMWDLMGDSVAALDELGRLLGACGRVLPMAAVPLDITATVRGVDPAQPHELSTIRGQVEVATAAGRVVAVDLIPPNPPACPDAVKAIHEADWIVLGPGSWYSSVLPHLLVPELLEALVTTPARRCVTLSVAPQPGETDGFGSSTYLEVLAVHATDLRIDVVVADATTVLDRRMLQDTAAAMGGELVVADIAARDGSPRHDDSRLAATYREIMT